MEPRALACLVALVSGCGGVEPYRDVLKYNDAVSKLGLVGLPLAEAEEKVRAEGYACSRAERKSPMRPPFDDVACSRRSSGWVCVQPQYIYLHYRKGEERVEQVTPGLGVDVCL